MDQTIGNLLKILNNYLPQILVGLWAFIVIAVLLLSYISLKQKKEKWTLNLERFQNFTYISPGGRKRDEWIQKIRLDHYEDYYKAFKGLFIAHVFEKSKRLGSKYDIYIYIVGEQSKYFKDIFRADFMLGPLWNNHVFPSSKINGYYGIATSASEPFLCTCCVTLRDGRRLFMDRFIDFEMSKFVE